VNVRLGDDKKICLLVVIGVTESGHKELIAVQEGYRESKESWLNVLRSLIDRGFKAPLLAIGDGALGFWSAIGELEEFQKTKWQRCWVHKIANVLNKLPKRVQSEVKSLLHEMMKAPDLDSATKAKNRFQSIYSDKYPKAVTCLEKDWSKLITFFDFPAAHWMSLRTTNPIESCFATVKLRTRVTKGAGSPKTAASLAFKLLLECEKKWRMIRGWREITNLIEGVEYKDGVVLDRILQNQEIASMQVSSTTF
jgi:putative transposase